MLLFTTEVTEEARRGYLCLLWWLCVMKMLGCSGRCGLGVMDDTSLWVSVRYIEGLMGDITQRQR